jgi:hypothetical protein
MLSQAELDVMLVLTGPGTHVDFTLAALRAGPRLPLFDGQGARQIGKG